VVKETGRHAPYSHSLPLLASKLELKIPEGIKEKLAGFMEFYLEARYPDQQKEYYQKCTKDFARKNLKEIKEVFKWLKARLEKK